LSLGDGERTDGDKILLPGLLNQYSHLCVVTNRESNVDVHLNNNYCFRCRLPMVADAKNLDRQFDDLLLKFHR
jgi:hypothetical protein